MTTPLTKELVAPCDGITSDSLTREVGLAFELDKLCGIGDVPRALPLGSSGSMQAGIL